ncbi:AAA family ATPase [Pedobacter sp. BS3]|uniref:helix-turn-helix domain-containing protein n=1 Tax=Pedobacter sp. BS3 TaxID=2567937 RepID=UPI0011EFE276|nr:helix-turn-helix domain-containing protein [Pedobacter sp. BS3]TZF83862.1 AAA family ATPase [Pedobacter sp. BS3]
MQLSGTDNKLFQQAAAFVNQTQRHIFLTGKAGTGKTTFLKHIRENSHKKMAVVAPTGVAAINAGGVTIHSFFQIPPGLFLPTTAGGNSLGDNAVYNSSSLLSKLRLNQSRLETLRELELLIIDEVSMVRADVLDAMDTILRHVRKRGSQPFGGVQVLYIGDLFQLPPVTRNVEWMMMQEYYQSPFFFDALVIKQAPPVYIELKKIYRQADDSFIRILNNIRNNCCNPADLEQLNTYYKPDFEPEDDANYITLTSHNHLADQINRKKLEKLPGEARKFEARVKGDFSENAYPADYTLTLKEGAQVMFIKNDKGEERRYYNGKIGIIKKILSEGDKILIHFPGEEDDFEMTTERWQNIRYNYSKENDAIDEEVLGTFTQYPIRLAWAITIHKSQGLTFDKAIIDAGASFAPGQVYVALSRLTSMNGLVLTSTIQAQSIQTDKRIVDFTRNELPDEILQQTLEQEQLLYVQQSLLNAFDYSRFAAEIEEHAGTYENRLLPDEEAAGNWLLSLQQAVENQKTVSEKFTGQLQNIINIAPVNYALLHERTASASAWFTQQLEQHVLVHIENYIDTVRARPRTKKYVKELKLLALSARRKKEQISQAAVITGSLQSATQLSELLEQVDRMNRPSLTTESASIKPARGETKLITLEMYKQGMPPEEIAAKRELTTGTIIGHLAEFIGNEVPATVLIPEDKLNHILQLIKTNPNARSSELKQQLSDDYSYTDIKVAQKYFEVKKAEGIRQKA